MRSTKMVIAIAIAGCGGDRREETAGLTGIASLDGGAGTGMVSGDPSGQGEGTAANSGESEGDDAADGTDGTQLFDVGGGGDESGGVGGCGEGYGFSIIWIANTDQGTVSKLDTVTMVELARYYTHPSQGGGLPSRTSVNLIGDVAVTNRQPGGVAKIANLPERCVDADGDGQITTSSGPNDVLPWGTDECVLWFLPIDTDIYEYGPRPTAWESGMLGEDPCEVAVEPRLWVAYKDQDDEHGIVWRLDGTTGAVLDEVDLGPWSEEGGWGPYGGAVQPDGDLVLIGKGEDRAVVVDAGSLDFADLPIPEGACNYGMGLGGDGNLWVGDKCGKVRFYDFGSGDWTEIADVGGDRVNGVQVDRDGNVWAAGVDPCRLVRIDAATRNVIDANIPLPGCQLPWGISIDGDGFVWVVDRGNAAFKVDPATYAVQKVNGLVSPYTYSDMTGFALGLVTDPPG